MTPSERLSLFEQRRAIIETQFATGKIDIATRRRMLIAARDDAGIPAMRTTAPVVVAATGLASMTEEEYRCRRRQADRRRYADKLASETATQIEG